MSPAQKLAAAILAHDEDNPGEPDATMEVPADVWAEWVNLAGEIEADAE